MPGQGTYYFEVKIDKAPENGYVKPGPSSPASATNQTPGSIGVGFCEENSSLNEMVGWNPGTWGYHGDDGHAFSGDISNPSDCHGEVDQPPNGEPRDPWGPGYTTGDVIGCGVNFEKEIAFYTKNGDVLGESLYSALQRKFLLLTGLLGRAFTGIRGKLYPAISLDTTQKNVAVSVTFWDGTADQKDVFKYKGSWEDPATLKPPVPKQVDVEDDDDSQPATLTPASGD
jgi:hypothetical protein